MSFRYGHPDNLFLRKQLTLYEERQVKPARATNAIRLAIRLNRTSVWTMTAVSFNLGSVSIRDARVSCSRSLVPNGHFDADRARFEVASKAAGEGFVKHLEP